MTVPCFLDRPGCPPGSRFQLGPDGLPQRIPGNTYQAAFICNIPRSATPAHPARPSLYGHGLFGDAGEVGADNVEQLGNENDVLVCARRLDRDGRGGRAQRAHGPARPVAVPDPGRPPPAGLPRLHVHRAGDDPPERASPPTRRSSGRQRPLIDTRRLFYYGNSQGGIAGGALTAVAPDFNRSVLYVGAMNYSLLLTRSVDFDPFALGPRPVLPDPLERPLLLSLIQMLWDRGEPNGYAWHMTSDPLPNTPRHKVLQLLSFGDHQVANVATEVEARTIGSHLRLPAVDPGRHTDATPYYGIPPIDHFPYGGDASLVVWDIGPLRRRRGRRSARRRRRPRTRRRGSGVDPHDLVIESEARIRAPDLRVPAHRRQGHRRVRRVPLPRRRLDRARDPAGGARGRGRRTGGGRPGERRPLRRGRSGRRRSVLPQRGQRRVRRGPLLARPRLRPARQPARRQGRRSTRARPRACPASISTCATSSRSRA